MVQAKQVAWFVHSGCWMNIASAQFDGYYKHLNELYTIRNLKNNGKLLP